ncbi:MAG: nuclear transport factor 2 family protein [Bacteroidia bacterium]|nr:nuclear transport factor 2 family protein [Bacteroidia bacterium]NNC84616.1 nuclear transport factor 2 family protein [Bacteroidia bacterium]NNM16523.1 nuclear transport factor 2 family protein [Bacteroidia bacterium]
MKKNLILVFVLAAFIAMPVFSQAQNWSAEQKEVWTAVNSWWDNARAQNAKALNDMAHKDYKGWGFNDAFPSSKADLEYWVTNLMPKRKTLHTSLKPLEILVNGNTAVLHYYYSEIRMKDGKEENVSGRWTDVWIKENGKWMLYADSGGEIKSND